MISAVVLAKNEEKRIIDCLESLYWCDEIIVVDDYSSDLTVSVIESLENKKIKIFERALNNDFAAQRNFALRKADFDWVLFVDADERVTDVLANEIKFKTGSTHSAAFFIRRIDNVWGRNLKYGETGNIKFIRLAKKNVGKWVGKIHEKWEIDGKKENLESPLIHYPFREISEFLLKINFYTDLRAKELFDSGKKANWVSVIFYAKGKFLLNYFLKLGILDGVPGLIHAVVMSFHSFLVRGKLWFLWQKD